MARREHSAGELRRKLRRKGYDKSVVDNVLDGLIGERLLSDERFVENYVRYRRERGFGPLRIMAELRERNISENLIAGYLDVQAVDWYEVIRNIREKRFGDEVPQDFNKRIKQANFLRNRGFTSEQIWKILGDNTLSGE